jgi:hypothetical protein
MFAAFLSNLVAISRRLAISSLATTIDKIFA